MLYCEHCHNLYEERCALCNRSDGREVLDDDLCFVTEQNDLWSSVVEDIFRQAGMPCVRRQCVGVAPYVGANLARYRFYVPFLRYEEATNLVNEILEPTDDLEAEDGEAPEDAE